ncbi:unnamed protein product, partial [marine sediment metagenome]
MIPDSVLTKLANLDTPTVCNVIELFEVRPRHAGYVRDAGIRCNYPSLLPIVGYAATAVARSTFAPVLLLIWVLITQFLPPVVVVLPFFALFRQLGLADTKIGLVWINLSIVLPYSIWMIKGFVDALPSEIEQAALIDGANEYQSLRYNTIPLLMPSIITAAVFSFILVWNEFLFALILTRQEARALTIGFLSNNIATGIR